ncbi:hypothetical protein EDB85DRAFT_1868164, partial [Lactarius pseudohatsudake]
PEYIHRRIERLGEAYDLRIILLKLGLMLDIVLGILRPIQELMGIYFLNSTTIVVAWLLTNDETRATQYLAAYKQSEHRPPTLICERIFKTPGVALRTALTSIPRLNRTNFETVRASLLRPDPPALHRSPTPCPRSSSPYLRASPDSA